MRKWFLGAFFLVIATFGPNISQGAGLVPCGGPDEEPCQMCHVADLVNGGVDWLVTVLTLLLTLVIAYAGFLLVTSAGNTSAMEKAKSMFTNSIIGFAIVLAAWLLIDYGMKMLMKDGEAGFGPWNELTCVDQPELTIAQVDYIDLGGSHGIYSLSAAVTNGNFGPNSGPGSQTACQVAPEGSACSVSALQRAGFGSLSEAASRIAGAESGCNTNAESRTDTTTDGRTYSVGTWQINLAVHRLQCTLSNGQSINLNCPSAFRSTGQRNQYNVRIQQVVNEDLYRQCVQMAKDGHCNNQIAAGLARRSGDMGDWACSARRCGINTSRNHLCPLR